MAKLTKYLKTADAAKDSGVSQNTLRSWAAKGHICMQRNPANGYRLFKQTDLDKFLHNTEKPVQTTHKIKTR